jgi:hypothetical protein
MLTKTIKIRKYTVILTPQPTSSSDVTSISAKKKISSSSLLMVDPRHLVPKSPNIFFSFFFLKGTGT